MNIKIGDILEIPTSLGLTYVLAVFDYQKLPKYGLLMNCYNQKFNKRPAEEKLRKMFAKKPDFTVFVGLNNKNMQELGVEKVGNIGDQGFTYDNLPRFWKITPTLDLSAYGVNKKTSNIKKSIALGFLGGKEEIYYKLNNKIMKAKPLVVLNIFSLRDWLQNNHDSEVYLKQQWLER